MRRIIVSVGGVSAFVLLGLTATWPSQYRWNLVPGLSLVMLTCLIVYPLTRRMFVLAQVIWQAGLTGAIAILAHTFGRTEIMFLTVLLPLMAAATLGWLGGVMSGAWVVALALYAPGMVGEYRVAIAATGSLCGLLGWVSTSSLVTAMDWFWYSYQSLQSNLDEVRQHRAQLNRALTQLDHANYQLERANTQLVAAWRAADGAERFKAEFVANVSHELRTPLNLIIGFAEVMVTSPESYGGEPLPGAYRSDIYAMYNSAKHLRALVDDVLDLGRIDANKVALVLDQASISALVAEVESMVRNYITAKGLDLQFEIQADLPDLRMDRLRVRQVLLNLLVNAARFTDRGYIRLQVSQQGASVLFRVSDTGRGIAPEDLPHVFEPFHATGHQPETPWHTGTGLGVPISKRFVEMHGGQMGVESMYLQGTTFWFTLPCQPCAEPAVGESPSARPSPRDSSVTEHVVVVVNPDETLPTMLERHIGVFKFVGAPELRAGVALAQEHAAIAIVADVTAPDSLPALDVPLVNLPWPTGARVAASIGARDMLIKPIAAQQLLAALDRIGRPVQRVLIAADDPELVRLFRRMLRPRIPAQNCLEAFTGPEALERIENDRPDLVLLDISLQQLDAARLLARLAADAACRDIPVILVGDDWQDLPAMPGPIQVFRQGGFSIEELARTLRAILEAVSAGRRAISSTAPAREAAPIG